MGTKKKKTATTVNGEGRKINKAVIFPHQMLLEEMVWEILIRLPVKSLSRFKVVSKAWHAIISDPLFVQAHLHCSKHRQPRVPSSMLVAPRSFLQSDEPYTPISTDTRFYHWSLPLQQQLQRPSCRRTMRSSGNSESAGSTATLLYQRRSPAGEFRLGAPMAHCDGLVLLPSDTNVYVFNPAIRDVVALPESRRNVIQYPTCLPVGLGLDPSTGRYKVARSFYRHCDDYGHITMGMEVFTISSGQGQDIILHELDRELCATFFSECLQRVLVWMTRDVLDPRWSLYYIINFSSLCYPVASLGSGTGVLLVHNGCIYRYHLQSNNTFKEDDIFDINDLRFLGPNEEDTLGHAWKNLYCFDRVSYRESLVPITPPKLSFNV